MTWWFDHHQSAFLTPADAENFREHPGPKMFYEPDYKSCTMLIANVSSEKFGFDTKPMEELIHWGDIIDGAQYPTAQSAVDLVEPATQLALVIEAAPESGLPAKIVPELAYRPLAEMVKLADGRQTPRTAGARIESRLISCASEEKRATA